MTDSIPGTFKKLAFLIIKVLSIFFNWTVSPKALPDDGSLSPLQAFLAWKYNPYMHKSPKNDQDIPVKIINKIYKMCILIRIKIMDFQQNSSVALMVLTWGQCYKTFYCGNLPSLHGHTVIL